MGGKVEQQRPVIRRALIVAGKEESIQRQRIDCVHMYLRGVVGRGCLGVRDVVVVAFGGNTRSCVGIFEWEVGWIRVSQQ